MIYINYKREKIQYLNPDQFNKYIYSSREVIEIQSRMYYKNNPSLGFKTLAETDENYPIRIGELILEFTKKNSANKLINILELGPGTGRFFERLIAYLHLKNVHSQYTMVDISAKV